MNIEKFFQTTVGALLIILAFRIFLYVARGQNTDSLWHSLWIFLRGPLFGRLFPYVPKGKTVVSSLATFLLALGFLIIGIAILAI